MAKKAKAVKVWAPPVAFYFKLEFSKASEIFEMAFSEVSGLSETVEVEEVEEGGEPGFKHKLPLRRKHNNLVCKRSLYPLKESPLSRWVRNVLEGDFSKPIEPANVFISILNEKGDKVAGWHLTNLYPVKWELSTLDSKKNELAIETIEFVYNTILRKI